MLVVQVINTLRLHSQCEERGPLHNTQVGHDVIGVTRPAVVVPAVTCVHVCIRLDLFPNAI